MVSSVCQFTIFYLVSCSMIIKVPFVHKNPTNYMYLLGNYMEYL